MQILFYILWITFLSHDINSQILTSVKNRYNKELTRDHCISRCFDGTASNLIIQLPHYPLRNPYSAVIHFSCYKTDSSNFPKYFNLYRFAKLCGDNIEICEDNQIKYLKKNKYINIALPINITQTKLKLFECSQEVFFIELTVGGYRERRNLPPASGSVLYYFLRDLPVFISLSVWKPGFQHVGDIYFNVTRNLTNLFTTTRSSLLTISNDNKLKNISISFNSYLNEIQNFMKQRKNNKEKLSKVLRMVTKIPSQYKKSFNKMNSTYRRKVSKSLIKNVENLLKNVSNEIVKNNQSYQQFTDSFVLYSCLLNRRRRDFVIPLSENKSVTSNQFVKINILGNETVNAGPSLMTNFIRFKDMDIMNELSQIQLKAKNKTLIISNPQNVVERHKNSDIIYLSLSQHVKIKVKFKLSKLSQYKSPTWLYAFEEECGYLDKNSSWKWLVDGCRKVKESNNQYYCECNHLSNFALLFSIKTINVHHLVITHYLSIFSGLINIVSLAFFLIFILFINSRDKLRLDQLNITICLLMGTIIFFIGGFASKNEIVCKLAALLTQFFFLSAFNWKLIFGINVLRMIAFLKYENENRMIKYRICSISISYGLSLIICIISGTLKWQFYGEISDDICWMENQSPAFLSFIIPIGIILVVNVVILVVIAKVLIQNFILNKKIKVNKSKELLVFLQLFVAMGMTWIPSYFATVYLAAIYLWILFFPLQGFLMFIFVVVVNKENRQKVSLFMSEKFSSLASKYSVTAKSPIGSKSTSNIDSRTTQLSPISPNDQEQRFPLITSSVEERILIPPQKKHESESKFSFNNASIEKKVLPTPRKTKQLSPISPNDQEQKFKLITSSVEEKVLIPPQKRNINPVTSNRDENQNEKEVLVPPEHPIFFKK